MPATVVIEAAKLIGRASKISKEYRQQVLNTMDEYFDEVRDLADTKYLIPDKYPGSKRSAKYRLQPSDPVRLTSRTGAYKKMLHLGQRKWKKGSSIHRSSSAAIQVNNRTLSKNTVIEAYEGTISYSIKDPRQISSVATAQQLRMRFRHTDNKGIRGRRRKGLIEAGEDIGLTRIEAIAKKRVLMVGGA